MCAQIRGTEPEGGLAHVGEESDANLRHGEDCRLGGDAEAAVDGDAHAAPHHNPVPASACPRHDVSPLPQILLHKKTGGVNGVAHSTETIGTRCFPSRSFIAYSSRKKL